MTTSRYLLTFRRSVVCSFSVSRGPKWRRQAPSKRR